MRKTTSTNFENESRMLDRCPVYAATRLIAARWRTHILWALGQRPMRFSELVRSITGATERMIALRLRQMAADDLVRVEGSGQTAPWCLTERGKRLLPLLVQLVDFARQNGTPSASVDKDN